MTPERWEQVSEALGKALHLSARQRQDYLAEIAHSDPELSRELESLLASHQEAGAEFLNMPALKTTPRDSKGVQGPRLLGER